MDGVIANPVRQHGWGSLIARQSRPCGYARLDRVIATPSFMGFTVHTISSPASSSIIFTTASGIVVLRDDELGRATVTLLLKSATHSTCKGSI